MTVYPEAYQMALTANLIEAAQIEINCAGDTLCEWLDEGTLTEADKVIVTHVLNHLSVVRELNEYTGNYIDVKLAAFNEEHPGKLDAVSVELRESKAITDMQKIVGMTPEEVIAIIEKRDEEMAAK
jgi:hypothetical protein